MIIRLAILCVKINYWLRGKKLLPDQWCEVELWLLKRGIDIK